MNKNLIDKIYEFTKYLKEYESDKNYYEQQLLPAIFEDYKISGLPLDAKTLLSNNNKCLFSPKRSLVSCIRFNKGM